MVVAAAVLSALYKIVYKYFFDELSLGQCCYSLAIIGFLGKNYYFGHAGIAGVISLVSAEHRNLLKYPFFSFISITLVKIKP